MAQVEIQEFPLRLQNHGESMRNSPDTPYTELEEDPWLWSQEPAVPKTLWNSFQFRIFVHFPPSNSQRSLGPKSWIFTPEDPPALPTEFPLHEFPLHAPQPQQHKHNPPTGWEFPGILSFPFSSSPGAAWTGFPREFSRGSLWKICNNLFTGCSGQGDPSESCRAFGV